jgi:rhamnosyltransferase
MNHYPTPDDICAVITTFRPDNGLYQRVVRVKEQVGFVVIINDGECGENVLKLNKWFEGIKNIHVHHNSSNVGIAASLNIGISLAKKKEYRWILILDDDSLVRPNLVKKLINGMKSIKINKPIGIIGMSWTESNDIKEEKPMGKNVIYSEKRGIITSGSFFPVETYDIVGPFREEFYIDSVDYDFCLRAREKGFAIIKLDEIGFEHSLGSSKVLSIMGFKIIIENHEVFRIYYGFRNLTVLALEYLKIDTLYSFTVLVRHMKILFIILIFETNKIEKLIEAFRGLKDGLARNLGKRIRVRG